MACRLYGAKPLSEPMCWDIVIWILRNILQWNVEYKYKSYIFIQENAFENVCEIASILEVGQVEISWYVELWLFLYIYAF